MANAQHVPNTGGRAQAFGAPGAQAWEANIPAADQGTWIIAAIRNLAADVHGLRNDQKQLITTVTQLDGKAQGLENGFHEFHQSLEDTTNTLGELKTQFGGFQTNLTGFGTQLGSFGTQIGGFQTQFGSFQTQLTSFGTQIGGFQMQFGSFQTQLTSFGTQIGGFQTQFGSFQTQLTDVQTQLKDVQIQLTGVQASCVFPLLNPYGILTHSLNSQRLLPMRLYNSSANDLTPLKYPTGVSVSSLPATRVEFLDLTGKCSATMCECEPR